MHSYILVGSEPAQEKYLESFKKENKIPAYLIFNFETFKISDARSLQKLLSFKLAKHEKRLISISSPTLEAQNALLKTVEEVPAQNFIFFLVSGIQDLLPTISSRCSKIFLDKENKVIDENRKSLLMSILDSGRLEEIPAQFDQTVTEADFEEIILIIRNYIISKIENSNTKDLKQFTSILKNLNYNFNLTKTNNVNKKIALDNSFML